MSVPYTRFVLTVGHVQSPMTTIFDTPVTADRVGELLDAHRQATDVIARLRGFFAIANAHQGCHTDRLQSFPQFQASQSLRHGHLQVAADLLTAMSGFFGGVPTRWHVRKVVFALFVDVVDASRK